MCKEIKYIAMYVIFMYNSCCTLRNKSWLDHVEEVHAKPTQSCTHLLNAMCFFFACVSWTCGKHEDKMDGSNFLGGAVKVKKQMKVKVAIKVKKKRNHTSLFSLFFLYILVRLFTFASPT